MTPARLAAGVLRDLEERTRAGTDWVLGVWARSAALLSDGDAAETLYREAIERFDRAERAFIGPGPASCTASGFVVRTGALDAREQLRAAHEIFGPIRRRGLRGAGPPRAPCDRRDGAQAHDDTRDILTPQEAQIAALARDGLSNPEIGARLFISPERCSTTCARSSRSSTSPRATSSAAFLPDRLSSA